MYSCFRNISTDKKMLPIYEQAIPKMVEQLYLQTCGKIIKYSNPYTCIGNLNIWVFIMTDPLRNLARTNKTPIFEKIEVFIYFII